MVHFHPSQKWHTSYPKEISIDVCLPIFIKTFSLGTLFGITNGVSMLVSWLGPVMVGFMTDENVSLFLLCIFEKNYFDFRFLFHS